MVHYVLAMFSKRLDMTMEQDSTEEAPLDARDAAQRRTLITVLIINFLQAAAIGAVGAMADSTGLMGAALDNLADGLVYAVSVYAVGRSVMAKVRAAHLSGIFLIVLALGLLVEVLRRFVDGGEPVGMVMIIAAIANGAANLVCLRLLRAHRRQEVNLRASWIFTTNDMVANAGIALSGVAVMLFHSPLPDLVIGLVVVGIALKGGWEILEQARDTQRETTSTAKEKKS